MLLLLADGVADAPAPSIVGAAAAAKLPSCAMWSPGDALVVIIVALFAVMFSLFTSCLFTDQMSNILSNTTAIDRLKGHDGHTDGTAASRGDVDDSRAMWENLEGVFGGDPWKEGVRLTWLLPTPISYGNPESLTGYCFRDVPRPRTLEEMESV